MFALRGLRTKATFLPGTQATLTHQSGHAVFAALDALGSQGCAQSWAAIGLTTLRKNRSDHFNKLLVFLVPRSLRFLSVSVEAAF